MTAQPQRDARQGGSFPLPIVESGINGPDGPRGRIAADFAQARRDKSMRIAWVAFIGLLLADALLIPILRTVLLSRSIGDTSDSGDAFFGYFMLTYDIRDVAVMILGMVAVVYSGVSFFSSGWSRGNLFAAIPLLYSLLTMLITVVEWFFFRVLVE